MNQERLAVLQSNRSKCPPQKLCCICGCGKRLQRICLDPGRALRLRRLVSGQQKGYTTPMVMHTSVEKTHDAASSLGVSDLRLSEFIESSVTSFSCKSRPSMAAIVIMTLYSRPCLATKAPRRQREQTHEYRRRTMVIKLATSAQQEYSTTHWRYEDQQAEV